MFEEILNYIVQYGPALLAIILESAVVKYAFKMLANAKQTKEFKDNTESNKLLAQKIDEQYEKIEKLTNELRKVNIDHECKCSNKEI